MFNYALATKYDMEDLINMRIAYINEDMGEVSVEDEQVIKKRLLAYFETHLEKELFAFVTKHDGRIVATAFLLIIEKPANANFINGKIGEVLNVYTVEEYRKQGIATKLMEQMLVFAKEQELDFVELKATKEGLPIYKKLGFKEQEMPYVGMRYKI